MIGKGVFMLSGEDLKSLEGAIGRQRDIIVKYEKYLEQITEPQIKSDIQGLLAQHRNLHNTMLKIMEGEQ